MSRGYTGEYEDEGEDLVTWGEEEVPDIQRPIEETASGFRQGEVFTSQQSFYSFIPVQCLQVCKSQGFGAGAFSWSQGRHFGPSPNPSPRGY